MHALPLFLLLFAGSTTSSGGSEDEGDDLGAESETGGYEDSGDDDPNAGPPAPPKPKAKGCRLAGDTGMAALLPALLLLRRRARRG